MRDQRNVTIGCRPSRNRVRVWLVPAAGASLALLLAGCGSVAPFVEVSVESSTSTMSAPGEVPTESVDTVSWLNGFCGAVSGLLADNNAMQVPTGVPGDDGRQGLSKMLSDYAAMLDKAINRLTDLPPIADPVGETAKQTFVEKYTSARDTAISAKAQLDAASPDDFDAMTAAAAAMTEVQQTALSAISPASEVADSPELSMALSTAEQCM